MSVKIIFHSNLSKIAGKEDMEVGACCGDVGSLIDKLVVTYPQFKEELFDNQGQLDFEYQILVNGKSINSMGGTATPLADGDEVAFLLPLSGGAH